MEKEKIKKFGTVLLKLGFCVTFLNLLHPCCAEEGTIGLIFKSENVKESGCEGIFLFADQAIPAPAIVYKFSAYVVQTGTIWFQIWRPLIGGEESVGENSYELIGQRKLSAKRFPKVEEVTLEGRNKITAQAGDLIGIYNDDETCTPAYLFQAGSQTYSIGISDPSRLQPGFIVRFSSLLMPYKLSVQAHYDTDISRHTLPSGTYQTTDRSNSPTSASQTVPTIPETDGSYRYQGNTLNGKTTFMASNAKGMYILPHMVLPRSVVTTFYAYFAQKQTIYFQIWRPYGLPDSGSFVLVGEHAYEPELVPELKEIRLEDAHIFANQGDIVGFTCPTDIGPIGYLFMNDPSSVGPRRASLVNDRFPDVAEIVNFNPEKHPYNFALGVVYDTDVDRYGTPPEIHPTFKTPTQPQPSLPPTNPHPLVTVDSNSGYHILGEDHLKPANLILAAGARRTFLSADMKFPTSALIMTFYIYAVQEGSVMLQVWRPEHRLNNSLGSNAFESGKYQLIASNRYDIRLDSNDADGTFESELIEFALEEDEYIAIQEDDTLGFANAQDISVVGYRFEPTMLLSAEAGFTANVNDLVAFDSLSFPYKFAIGALYKETVEPTTASTAGDSPDDPHTHAPQPLPQLGDENGDYAWFTKEEVLFAMFIWLIILTIIVMLLIFCNIYLIRRLTAIRRAQDKNKKLTSFLYDYETKNSVTRPPSAYLAGNESMTYFNPQTGTRNLSNMRNRGSGSMRENLISRDTNNDNFMSDNRRNMLNNRSSTNPRNPRREDRDSGNNYSRNINNNNYGEHGDFNDNSKLVADVEHDFEGNGVNRYVSIVHNGDMSTHM